MARKSKGRSGGRGGNGSGPSSSSPASRPQQQETAAGPSTSTSSPIPCPPGYLWDGKRFYKMPPNLSRVRITDGSSSDSDRPRKEPRSDASSSSPARRTAERPQHQASSKASPLQDLTAIAFSGEDDHEDASSINSAFDFTPAKPPAAQLSLLSSSCEVMAAPPRDVAPSMAFAKRWKMHATQRHVDSYKLYSRDLINYKVVPVALEEWEENRQDDDGEFGPFSNVRVDTFAHTGGLIWLQAEPQLCVETYDVTCTRGATFLESAGRSYAEERLIGSPQAPHAARPQREYGGEDSLGHSHIGFSTARHPQIEPVRDQVSARLYGFSAKSRLARGLIGLNHSLSAQQQWPQYEMPSLTSVLTAQVLPQLAADATFCELLHPTSQQHSERPTELSVALRVDMGEYDMQVCEIHWAPSSKAILGIKPPHRMAHTAVALSQGSGFCWTGYSDGHIELFDPAAYTADVIAAHPRHEQLYAKSFHADMLPPPDFHCVFESSKRGSVLSLYTVGATEAVAIFSSGAMLLLKATSSRRVDVVRQFAGHDEQGLISLDGRICVHEASRLVAFTGRLGSLRIWHLDDAHPLNTPWHRKRKRGDPAFKLVTKAKSQHERLLARIKEDSGNSDANSHTAQREDEPSFYSLAGKSLSNADSVGLLSARLADLPRWSGCGITFAPTSWFADRDGQWEYTREFANGKPQLVGAGLFPALVCCVSVPRGPTLLYFEPENRSGVSLSEEGFAADKGGQKRSKKRRKVPRSQ